MRSKRSQQSGFTLVEIAIVLVIIGLLLGGILKGQELINSAKVKNLANDFRTTPTFVYGYQDKYKALPGDDVAAVAHLGAGCAAPCQAGNGNGVIQGNWNSVTQTDETWQFWGHIRRANLAPGPTTWAAAAATDPYVPTNAVGGRVGFSSAVDAQLEVDNLAANATNPMRGTYQICSSGILGSFVKQLDIQMDDGQTNTGSMRAHPVGAALGAASTATTSVDDATAYVVCMTF
jgi:prepilin-type N-terminal cleavage/methylation domain-containing protein